MSASLPTLVRDSGRTRQPAQAPPRSPDGLGVRTGGVGVGVETNGSEVVGRGVLVGEGVDQGEGGVCGGSVSPAVGLCLAPGPGRRLPGIGDFRWERDAGAHVFSARRSRLPLVVLSAGVGGWVARAARPQGRRRSAGGRLTVPVAIGSIIRSYEQSWQTGSRVVAVTCLSRGR